MLDTKILGTRIKELRKRRGLTQNAFAEALRVSFQAVSNWERGIAPPELENLINIAAYFGVLIDDLLCHKSDDLFLGIDGGGTKTEFVLVSSEGYVQKRILKSGCNPNDIGYAKMASLLVEGIGDVLMEYPSVKSVFCGIAGITTGDYAKRLYDELKKRYPQITLQIKSDAFNLFALDEKADMVVISGTGSVVFARTGDTYKRIGGWGYLFDEVGSAYDIAREAIRQALREEDMHEPASLMSDLLRKKLNVSTIWEHVNAFYREGKPYIAGLAPIVFEAFKQGDVQAIRIIESNAKGLADLLNAGIRLYGAAPIAIASGGLFEHHASIFLPYIQKHTNVALRMCALPPVFGACRHSVKLIEGSTCAAFAENFKNSYRGK